MARLKPNITFEETRAILQQSRRKRTLCSLEKKRATARASGARGGLPALEGGLPPPDPPASFFFKLMYSIENGSVPEHSLEALVAAIGSGSSLRFVCI